MTEYIVSARKYRPESFDTLIGQDNIARTLQNSILRGELAHAYLFCGPRGVGKTTTARIFAKMINCSSPSESMEPCGHCESCVSFAEGRSYCIHELDAASNNGVDDIKALIDQVRIPPQVGRYSVYIIDEVHMLSAAAFNAFLKTLEEPPQHAIFILATTEKHKILPTILSRCQTYDFNRITVDNIVRNLRTIAISEGVEIDDRSLHIIALKADGAMRDALTIFDQTVAFCGKSVKYEDVIHNLNVLDYDYTFNLVENFLRGDVPAVLRSFDDILAKGFNALHFVGALSSHLRDLMIARAGGADSLLEMPDSLKDDYRRQAAYCSEKFLYDALAITTACEQGYKTALNPRLHIEFALMKLCYLSKAPEAAASASMPQAAAPQPQMAVQPEAVQASAPQMAEQARPAEAAPAPPQDPQPRRRAAAAIGGLSVSSIKEQSRDSLSASQKQLDSRIPTDEEVQAKWVELQNISASNARLLAALQTAKLSMREEDGRKIVTYAVINSALRDWLQSKNSRIEAKFCELLGSFNVSLILDLQAEDPSQNVAVSAEDKARDMMEKNPEMRNLVSDLGLEIK